MMRRATARTSPARTQAIALWREPETRRDARCRFTRPGTCSARRRSASRRTACASSPRATTRTWPTRPARRSSSFRCDVFITEATFGLPVFRHPDPQAEIEKLLASVAMFPERAHLVGAYSLGKAQRVIALIRAGRLRRADLPARRDGEAHALYESARHRSRRGAPRARRRRRPSLPARSRSARRRRCRTSGRGAFRTRSRPLRRAGCACAPARARAASSCRWSSPTMPTGPASSAPSRRPARREIWVTHGAGGRAGALVRRRGLERGRSTWSATARKRDAAEIVTRRSMNRFAALLDRLAYEPRRNAKLRLLIGLFPRDARSRSRLGARGDHRRAVVPPRQARPHPRADRRAHRPGAVRAVLRLCRRPLGDRRADVAGAEPGARARPCAHPHRGRRRRSPTLGKSELPGACSRAWLDALDETGRWALLKLITGALRIGVSARLAKTAVAALGDRTPDEVELVWHGPCAALRGSVRLARGPRREAGQQRSGAVPAGDAVACDRGAGFRRARSRRTSRPNGNGTASACRRSRARRDGAARGAALLAHRRGYFRRLSRSDRGARLRRRDRRRAADPARGPRAELQRAAAAAQPQDRHREADRRVSRASPRLRSAGRGGEDLRDLPFAERRARLEALRRAAERPRASTSRR